MNKCACHKNHEAIDDDLHHFITSWQHKPGSLIMILHKVQKKHGYISAEIIKELAQILKISQASIYGVVTFYHFFKLKKPGKHKISVCTGTACYLKSSGLIIDELKKKLQVELGSMTEDGKFSLEEVRCLGCCGLAPVMSIDEKVYGRLQLKQLQEILEQHKD